MRQALSDDQPSRGRQPAVTWRAASIFRHPGLGVGLTPEAGGPAPRLNHALTRVVTSPLASVRSGATQRRSEFGGLILSRSPV